MFPKRSSNIPASMTASRLSTTPGNHAKPPASSLSSASPGRSLVLARKRWVRRTLPAPSTASTPNSRTRSEAGAASSAGRIALHCAGQQPIIVRDEHDVVAARRGDALVEVRRYADVRGVAEIAAGPRPRRKRRSGRVLGHGRRVIGHDNLDAFDRIRRGCDDGRDRAAHELRAPVGRHTDAQPDARNRVVGRKPGHDLGAACAGRAHYGLRRNVHASCVAMTPLKFDGSAERSPAISHLAADITLRRMARFG